MALGLSAIASAQQPDKAPPKELVDFIADAKKRGVDDDRIKRQALAVGWSADSVDQAIAYQKSGKGMGSTASLMTGVVQKPAGSFEFQPSAAVPEIAAGAAEGAAAVGTPKAQAAVSQGYEYFIGAGDTLQISVWKELEASVPSVVVRPDGKITVPLIKEVQVGGLTPNEAEKVITDALGKFIANANVTVVVAAMSSKKIYVTGGVKKEGPVPYTYGMTVMQALSEAGGLTDYARRKKIYILRSEGGREYRLDFNYDEVIKGEHMDQNTQLLPNDTLVIPH
jgi:polysaccharide export outer membrane protein